MIKMQRISDQMPRTAPLLGGYGTYQISATRQYYDVNKDKFYYAIQNK